MTIYDNNEKKQALIKVWKLQFMSHKILLSSTLTFDWVKGYIWNLYVENKYFFSILETN